MFPNSLYGLQKADSENNCNGIGFMFNIFKIGLKMFYDPNFNYFYEGTLALLEYYHQEDENFYYTLNVLEFGNFDSTKAKLIFINLSSFYKNFKD